MRDFFTHHALRRYLLAFGSLFDDMTVVREDASGVEQQRLVVPIDYGPKERWLYRLTQDPDFTRAVGQVVPRMSYEMTQIAYDTSRKLNTLDKLTTASTDDRKRARLWVGVPYTLTLQLTILTKLQQDGMQLVEQILPYFTPDYSLALRPIAEFPALVDTIPISLQSVSHSDNYEESFETRRIILWTLDFSMKVYFYGPIKHKKRIEEVFVNLYNSSEADLRAPLASGLPWAEIHVELNPRTQAVTANTTRDDVTTRTTITEHLVAPETPSQSPSASQSGSASTSPSTSQSASPSRSVSRSLSVSVSPSTSASPSASFSASASISPSPSRSSSVSRSPSASRSRSASPSASASPSS